MDDDVEIPTLTEIQSGSVSIPIPDPSYLLNKASSNADGPSGDLIKYKKEYEKFCQWSALPKDERKLKSAAAFEKKYRIPIGYTNKFRLRKDYQTKRLEYFWEWMFEKLPDVVLAMYKRAVKNSSVDARYFAEMISKHMDIEQPAQQLQNFFLVGVSQEKINGLFTPKKFDDNIKQLTPTKDNG